MATKRKKSSSSRGRVAVGTVRKGWKKVKAGTGKSTWKKHKSR